ncbi:MAG: hypothetical protein ACI36Z_06190 [Alloprevotella sp.]
MKKKYIAPTVEKIDLTYFEAVARDSHGLVNTSAGGADSDDVLSNKREGDEQSASDCIWNSWE